MNESLIQNQEKISLLQSYFSCNGVLSCNENKDLPSLENVGGDFNSIISLMERGEVFYSKLYKKRATYLSRELYYQIKPYKQRADRLSPKSKEILDFIAAVGIVTTKEIKSMFMLSAKAFSSCMDELFAELFVTVIQRDRMLNQGWSSFCWGTSLRWEQLKPLPEVELDIKKISALLSAIMTEKQIQSLLR